MKYVEHQFYGYELPDTCGEFINFLTNTLPKEFLDSAQIWMEVEDTYGGPTSTIHISYQREETEEEKADRISREEIAAREREERELAVYLTLKQKYGEK